MSDSALPIASENDILVVGLGYSLDGYGVGKLGGPEVLVQERSGQRRKFMGDAPVALAAWFKFLEDHGAAPPAGPHIVCGLKVYP